MKGLDEYSRNKSMFDFELDSFLNEFECFATFRYLLLFSLSFGDNKLSLLSALVVFDSLELSFLHDLFRNASEYDKSDGAFE
jgi:hypothetical protein